MKRRLFFGAALAAPLAAQTAVTAPAKPPYAKPREDIAPEFHVLLPEFVFSGWRPAWNSMIVMAWWMTEVHGKRWVCPVRHWGYNSGVFELNQWGTVPEVMGIDAGYAVGGYDRVFSREKAEALELLKHFKTVAEKLSLKDYLEKRKKGGVW